MHVVDVLLQIIYFVCIVGLALYGLQALWLTKIVLRKEQPNNTYPQATSPASPNSPADEALPTVTVQLPIYNEQHVIERLITACAALDYPSDRLQIQVLDDSDDITVAIVQQTVQVWAARGVNIEIVRREDRAGYKAGALAHALPNATGELVAIFDADFVPPENFLRCTVPHFLQSGNEDVGFVQTRWAHLNRTYSWITACQALALDGHFIVEQTGRAQTGYPFGFNGSAGIWRRATIQDPAVGGWQADTLCEDLDLSYRAQFAGWRGHYLPTLDVPAEIPAQMLAFKRQQARWAKGSIQTLRKLGRRLLQQPWTLIARLAGYGHLANYLIHPLLLIMLLVSLPMLLLGVDPARPLALLSIFSFGPPWLYAVAQYRLDRRGWLQRWLRLPLLMLIGTGLCLNNTIAVLSAFSGKKGEFLRTPKFHTQQSKHDVNQANWQQSHYRLPPSKMLVGEVLLCLYALLTTWVASRHGHFASTPFLLIYAAGFGLMALTTLAQAWPAFPSRPTSQTTHRQTVSRRNRLPARFKAHANRSQG